MEIGNSSFSLRDYISYVFPGIFFIFSFLILRPDYWVLIKGDTLLTTVIFLVGGYFFGYASNIIGMKTIGKIFIKVMGEPFSTTLSQPKRNGFNEKFSVIVHEKLVQYWGQEVVDAGEANLLWLCWRDIQAQEHAGLDYLLRVVSLWGLCTSTLLPSLLFAVFSIWKGYYLLASLSLIILYSFGISRVRLRREFSRHVYRIWYAKKRDS
jgi:hypothetical protein